MIHPIQNLVGRRAEQQVLQQRIDAARAGEGSVCFVSGDSGCGKTTLVDAVLDDQDRELRVCRLRCLPEGARPYGLLT
ncbi:MAG: BREX system ATP-binding domain-containing protein, partial [Verrucomicrobiales bacterium]